MAGTALRRLMSEYKQLTENPPDGLIAGPVSDDNYFEWEAAITGKEGGSQCDSPCLSPKKKYHGLFYNAWP